MFARPCLFCVWVNKHGTIFGLLFFWLWKVEGVPFLCVLDDSRNVMFSFFVRLDLEDQLEVDVAILVLFELQRLIETLEQSQVGSYVTT